jgi:hypothetical protein
MRPSARSALAPPGTVTGTCRFCAGRGGYSHEMQPETEKPADLLREAEQGQSERTPALALTGVTLAVAALVGVVLVIVVAVYLLA